MRGTHRTHGSTTLAAAACAAVLTLGLAGCGSSSEDGGSGEDATPLAAASTPAPPTPTPTPTPSAEPALALVDDEESADAGKKLVVKVLDNDTVTLADGASQKVEAALAAGRFTLAVDTAPEHGTAKLDGSTLVYTSSPGYGGEDQFTYRVDVAGQQLTGTAVVRITVAAPPPPPAPKPKPTPAKPKVSYGNCTAVRAAGAAPIRSGQPGYGPHLDRDGDGIGCESSSGGSGGSGGSSTSGGGGGSTYYKNCTAVRAAGADPIRSGEPGYGRHLDRDGDGVGCE
ncbi:excalibur calcium-binding domain-containing protein [Streptomyces sp. NPDC052236]|uniref:excalibur calcium-binding domain-containing protein n=1 Tax=Streptomyces sp. NPDC052236 TaxID=3365686 RepID=UPI0037D0D4C9